MLVHCVTSAPALPCRYLDDLNSQTAWGREWQAYYAVDPQAAVNGTAAQRALVIGGHACIWGEAVDATNIVQVCHRCASYDTPRTGHVTPAPGPATLPAVSVRVRCSQTVKQFAQW